jgi:hypothetical protein
VGVFSCSVFLDLRSDLTTKIIVSPGTDFCTRVRDFLRIKKIQNNTRLLLALDGLPK